MEHQGQHVAAKLSRCEDNWPFIIKEIIILKALDHPNIIQLKECIYTPSSIGYMMEIYESTLHDILMQSRWSEDTTLNVFGQICSAVCYCHSAGVIHADITPKNILCNGTQAVLCDFGLASIIKKNRNLVQNVFHRAPEVTFGMVWGAPADVWSLGILLYEMYRSLNHNIFKANTDCPLDIYRKIFGNPIGYDRADIYMRLKQTLGDVSTLDIMTDCLRFDPKLRPVIYDVYSRLLKKTTGVVVLADKILGDSPALQTDDHTAKIFVAECLLDIEGTKAYGVTCADAEHIVQVVKL